MHYLLFLFISVSSSSLLALDSFTLSGSVSSRSGDPLIGANVNVIGTVFGTATDGRGGYVFEVLRKSFSQDTIFVKASYIGYQSQLDTILIKDIENDQIEMHFNLDDDVMRLESVVVTGVGFEQEAKKLGVSIETVRKRAG